ncbi:MAG: T9SS type A sorting domain-containing protein [Chitinophagales bacterium]
MKPKNVLCKSLILLYTITLLFYSTAAYSDPLIRQYFNNCEELPDSWTAEIITGAANWETDSLPDLIETIVPECIAYFSDDSLGAAAPASAVQFTSPNFDASSYSTVYLDFDAYFFNFSQGTPTFELQVFDGTAFQTVFTIDENSFEGNHPLSRHFKVDLSDYINANMSIRFYFNDGGTHSGSIGLDNIEIDGTDNRTYLVLENFNDNNGTTPIGWSKNAITGPGEWNFGICPANASDETSIEGSNMAYFDDYSIGWNQLPSIHQLLSPSFDGRNYSDVQLQYDIHFRDYGDRNYLNVLLEHGSEITPIATYQIQNFSGNYFNDYVHASIDISEYRDQTMRVIFEYGDGDAIDGNENGYGYRTYWAGIDNFKISALQPINDFCSNATPIALDIPCTVGSNIGAIFQGPTVACVDSAWSAIWYTFVAPATGSVIVETQADFDDLVNVFSGTCGNFTEIHCINEDIYGFDGEYAEISGLNNGETYYLRISGIGNSFGKLQGDLCLQIRTTNPPTAPPANDLCVNAIPLTINAECVVGTNTGATFDGPIPSLNDKSDHSIWYSFEAPADGGATILTQANFSDVITLFEGTCGNLTELFCSDEGQVLSAIDLIPNQTYYLQISSFFNSLDGDICISVEPSSCDVNFAVEFMNVNQATCQGFDDGSAQASVTGGLSPYSYLWNDANETTGNIANSLFSGTYTVIVTDANQCTAFNQIEITGGLAEIQITGELAICDGNMTTLTGPNGFSSYSWNTGAITQEIEVNQSGTYTLTVEDGSNCIARTSVEITQAAAPEMPMVTSPAYYCRRDKVTHTVTAGDGGPVYKPSELTIVEGDDVLFQQIAGSHPTQSLSDPIAWDAFPLDSNNPTYTLTGLVEGVYPYECIPHAQFGMTGTIEVMNDSGDLEAMGENLLWYDSAMGGVGSPIRPIPDQSVAGTFYFYVSQTVNGCESERAEIQVIVQPEPSVEIAGELELCNGRTTILTATAGFVSYEWNTGSAQQEITATIAADYTVIVTDENGCTSMATVSVVESANCCPETVFIEYENDNALPELTQVQSFIRAGNLTGGGSVEVLNGQNVGFEVGEYVILEPGFSAETGGIFSASIEVCEEPPAIAEGEAIEVNESLAAQLDKNLTTAKTDLIVFPNPFFDDLTIAYYLAEEDVVTLKVYDVSGKQVKKLLEHEPQVAGTYKVRYESCNLQSGVYVCVLETSRLRKVLKVLKR